MKLGLDAAQRELRDEVAAFLRDQPPPDVSAHDLEDRVATLCAWQGQLAAAGLVGVSWPADAGGRGGTVMDQVIVNQALALAGAPQLPGFVGLDVVGPSIVAHGTPEQRARLLPGLLSAEEIWCQGFSEPGAGSDLAALATVAELRDGHFVIRGQKTWTSYAQFSRWCAVLARTDLNAPAHKGISYILVDMRSPGIEIRPMRLISGEAEFSEVFFDEVVVPGDHLLGELHGGWQIAMHTLGHERGTYAASRQATLRVQLDQLIAHARTLVRHGRPALEVPEIAQAITRAHVAVEVLGHQTMGSLGREARRGGPGPESSVDKLYLSVAEQAIGAASLTTLGPAATSPADDEQAKRLRSEYLYGRAASVYGGSAQIQRNIIAQRLLGLPRSS